MVSPLDGWRRKWTDLVLSVHPTVRLLQCFQAPLWNVYVVFSCIPNGIASGIRRETWVQILTFVKRRQLQSELLVSFVRLSSASLPRKPVSCQTPPALCPLWQSGTPPQPRENNPLHNLRVVQIQNGCITVNVDTDVIVKVCKTPALSAEPPLFL